MADNRVIGSGDDMLWHLPEDFARFDDTLGPFTLDVAAAPHNTKCARYFTYDSELDKYVLQYKLKDADLKLYDAATISSLAELSKEVFAGNDTIIGSKGDDFLTGFGKNDLIKGRDGNDTLHGDGGNDTLNGGNGYDYLDGGKGKDTFLFKSDPATGYDTITSFQDGERLKFKAKIFDGVTKGPLEDHQFALGAVATDADHRFLYDQGTGFLRYDSDGVGGADAVIVALLPANLVNLDAGNIFVI